MTKSQGWDKDSRPVLIFAEIEIRSLTIFLSFPVVSPTLKYGDQIIETDTLLLHSSPETVSCELYNAGPPLPELLELTMTEGDTNIEVPATDPEQSNVTCNWYYLEPLQLNVNDLTETVTHLQLLIRLF